MDPSEIIQIPYDLNRLSIFVSLPCVALLFIKFISNPTHLVTYCVSIIRFTLLSYAMMGLCGANIVQNYQHSLFTSVYIGSLLVTTIDLESISLARGKILQQLPFYGSANGGDFVPKFRLFTMLLTVIPFQILQILDWGGQIQRWPLPIILGITYGYVIGTLCGILTNYLLKQREQKKQEKQSKE